MKVFLITSLVIIAVIVAAWKINYPSGSWRYKVTVEVETPEGVKSGSSVHELSVGTPWIDLPDVGNPASIRGEAVVVDLGKRGVVFALMSNQSWQNGLYQAFPTEAPSSERGIEYYRKTLKTGMKGEWKEYMPRFVTFKDITDPKSVTMVYTDKRYVDGPVVDRFEELFGAGVKLKSITVEITDDPMTWDVKNWLPWFDELSKKGARLNGSTSTAIFTNELSDNLGPGSFTTGENR